MLNMQVKHHSIDRVKLGLENRDMPSKLHERIRAARRNVGLTQEKLGEILDVSKSAVAQWEAKNPDKRTKPTHANMVRIHQETGAALDWLVSDESEIDNIVRSRSPDREASNDEVRNAISPRARRLISRLEYAESSGSSTPQLLTALEAVLDLIPHADPSDYSGLDGAVDH